MIGKPSWLGSRESRKVIMFGVVRFCRKMRSMGGLPSTSVSLTSFWRKRDLIPGPRPRIPVELSKLTSSVGFTILMGFEFFSLRDKWFETRRKCGLTVDLIFDFKVGDFYVRCIEKT